ncbi:hypothetical protein B0H14DRAFT_2653048 [Mycena olivaceomarginata]|nr:hypothetical protein B0H14DRAFT_2653048 [Mycena olivaceomarginata]
MPRVPAFEQIQYLSRDHYHVPGPPDADLGNDSPDMAVKRVVDAEWKSFIQQKPLNVSPAFSDSPQAVYFGSRRREDGQVVHDLVNLNAVQVLYNKDDGRPCTLTGHLYSHLVQSPSVTSTVWPLEVPYPSDARIQQVMDQFRPLDQRDRNSSNAMDNPVDENLRHSSDAEETETEFFGGESQFLQYPDDKSSISDEQPTDDICDRCGEHQHSRIDTCPAWILPAASDQSIASPAHPTPRESPEPALNRAMQQGNGSSVTVPSVTVPSATINPVALNVQNMTREELIMRNLHELLGLDPTEPQNLIKLQDVARTAEMQAHEAFICTLSPTLLGPACPFLRGLFGVGGTYSSSDSSLRRLKGIPWDSGAVQRGGRDTQRDTAMGTATRRRQEIASYRAQF